MHRLRAEDLPDNRVIKLVSEQGVDPEKVSRCATSD